MSGELFPGSALETEFISRGEPVLLLIAFLAAIILAFSLRREISREFSGMSRRGWIVLAAIVLAGLVFRLAFVPVTQRIFFDEDLYLNTARNIASEARACMCNWGADTCADCILNKATSAHPFLLAGLSLFFGIAGTHAAHAALASAASVILAFLCAYLLFGRSEKAGLLSAAALSVVPVFSEWSNTVAAETSFIPLALATVAAAALYCSTGSRRVLFLLAAVASIMVQTKAEAFIFIIPLAAYILLSPRKSRLPALFLASAAILFLLSSAGFYHIYLAARGSDWGAEGQKTFSLASFKANLPMNSGYLLGLDRRLAFPGILTLMAAAGLALLVARRRFAQAALLAGWFLAFFLLYCAFYAGGISYGADVRYSLMYVPALALLAGALGERISGRAAAACGLALIASFAISGAAAAMTPAGSIAEARDARAYREFAVAAEIPDNCTVISHVTAIYLDRGISAAQPWYLEDPALLAGIGTPCVVLDYGFWCTVPQFRDNQCKRFLDGLNLTKLSESPDGRYSFYLVSQ